MKHCARITLQQLELKIFLGASDIERSHAQTVKFDIDIDFSTPPIACATDKLQDTHCYDSLIQTITEQITPRSFHLLEHLAHEVYQLIKRAFTQPVSVSVKVTKKPLLSTALVLESASFFYGDI